MAKAFLTGQQILDEYGRIDYDLIVAVAVRKELQPIDRLSGNPITGKDDPCLYCDGGRESEYGLEPPIGSQVPGRFCNADPDIFESCICYEWQDEQLAIRLRAATFSCDNVAAYVGKYWGATPGEQIDESRRHFKDASELVEYYRGQGTHERPELASLVDEEFTGSARLTDEALGRLLPANPGAEISAEGHKRQGHRLRKAYQ